MSFIVIKPLIFTSSNSTFFIVLSYKIGFNSLLIKNWCQIIYDNNIIHIQTKKNFCLVLYHLLLVINIYFIEHEP